MSGPPSRQRWALVGAAATALLLALITSRNCIHAGERPPGRGGQAPPFSLRTAGGKEYSLESLRGKVFILSFWDCYADVCFNSVPVFEAMASKYPPEKLTLVTVCFSVPAVMAADNYALLLKNCGMGQVILVDPEQKARELYQVETGPTTFLVDRDMTIRERIIGLVGLRGRHFENLTEDLVFPTQEDRPAPAGQPGAPGQPAEPREEGQRDPD